MTIGGGRRRTRGKDPGEVRGSAGGPQRKGKFKLIQDAREEYERNTYPWKAKARDESSKLWSGLSNRWAKAHDSALEFIVLAIEFLEPTAARRAVVIWV
jgi:hypothetical protein